MPTISMFYGILIKMFFDDHAPPHFHAEYGEFELLITLALLKLLKAMRPSALNRWFWNERLYTRTNYCGIGSSVKTCRLLLPLSLWSNVIFYYIETIKPDATNYSIKITYSDGVFITADFKELLEKGVMTLLKKPAVFSQVQIGNKRRSIVWHEQDIDFCADSLRLKFYQSPEKTEITGTSVLTYASQTAPTTNT
jgi:hypothetical protein